MDRSNHYEAAFEAYLRWNHLGYIAVDEARRSIVGDQPLKSLDFIVYGPGNARLLIDVKGRRYPGGTAGRWRFVWECWSEQDDVDGLSRWAELFGPDYRGLLVFAYHLQPPIADLDIPEPVWVWRERRYLFRAVEITAYRTHMKVRSPRWQTVSLPGAVYRRLAQPFLQFCDNPTPATTI